LCKKLRLLYLKDANPKEYSAVIFPGGIGAANNLCDFATNGQNCQVHPAVEKFCHGMIQAGKPAGFICTEPGQELVK
jgi:enhancing lycopene biosynthesis protein 2